MARDTATMFDLRDALTLLEEDEGGFALDAPSDWTQGRTLYGGITAAYCYAAAARALGPLPPLRSAQIAFVGPAAGRLRFQPAVLRRGRTALLAGVDCVGADGIVTRATFAFGADRDSAVVYDRLPRAADPPPDASGPFDFGCEPPVVFAKFEARRAGGSLPLRPGEAPEFRAWVRLRDGGGDDPVAALLVIADALPPTATVAFSEVRPVSTMTWTIDLHRPPPAAGGWMLVHSTSESAGDGYSMQAMRLHDRDGTPIASARQVVAIFA